MERSHCQVHPGERVSHYCLECKEAVCGDCLEQEHLYHHCVGAQALSNNDFAHWVEGQFEKMHGWFQDKARRTDALDKTSIEQYKAQIRRILLKKKDTIHKEVDLFFDHFIGEIHSTFSLFGLQPQLKKLSTHFAFITDKSFKELHAQIKEIQQQYLSNQTEQDQRLSLDGKKIMKDFQLQIAGLKKEWEERERTLKMIVKETFKLIELDINLESLQPFLKEKIKCNVRSENAKKFNVMFFYEEPQLNRLHYFKSNSKNVYFYNIDFHQHQKRYLKNEFKIPGNFASVQTRPGRIYLTGGSKNENESLNTCYFLFEGKERGDLYDKQADFYLVKKANMVHGRESHALVALNAKYLLAIGSRIFKQSATCEIYDMEFDQWHTINSLNYGRYYCSACAFSKRFIYVIGGINKNGLVPQIEKYDSFISESKWQVLVLIEPQWEGRYFCGSHQVSENKILVFGGFVGREMTNSSFELDVVALEVRESVNTQLQRNDSFHQRQPLAGTDKMLYAIGFESKVIHVYSGDEWKLLLKDQIKWKKS